MINHFRQKKKNIFFILLFSVLLFGISLGFAKGVSIASQSTEAENLDDGMVIQNYSGTEYGNYNQMNAGAPGSNGERQSYIKFSLTSLPQGSTISNASLQLYYSYDGMETDDKLSVSAFYVLPSYLISGQQWTEGAGGSSGDPCINNELCWNTRPTGNQISDTPESSLLFDKSQGAFSGWYSWPVTQTVQQGVNSGSGSVTIALRSSWVGGSLAASDVLGFRTKEHWDSRFRPKLVIEYETGPVNDVAVNSITAPASTTQGALVPITATVRNEGNQTESFTTTLNDLTDGVLIGSAEVTNLAAGSSLDLSFNWNTAVSSLGNHNLEARASVVAGETDTADNVKNTAVTIDPAATQRIKGATYKPNYGSDETVEFAALVMDNRTSIENNVRFIGVNDWNVRYRVVNPDSTVYQDWQNIAINNSWTIGRFNLSTAQTGTFAIQLELAGAAPTPSENITFTVSENNQVPFYRNEIIRAADFVAGLQNPDGSFPAGAYTSPGSPARVLIWAYKITGNLAYYNAAKNYLEDQINCSTTNNTLYSTCAYAEFQSSSNDAQFANNLNSCVQPTYNLRDTSPYYIERGEASYCLYKAWEATGNPTVKSYADDMVSSIANSSSWNAAKNTWYFTTAQSYYDGIFTGTLTALGIPWYSDISFINNAIQAQNLFVPQFYQDSSYGPGSTPSLYSFEINGNLSSGHFPHFTAEPAIAMSGLYRATQNRDWLLKASLPAKWIAQSQESDGRFEDIQSPADDIWSTMWAVWGLSELPSEVFIEVVDKDYNLAINNTAWNEKNKTLSANVTVPTGQLGKIRFIIPENKYLDSILIDGVPTSGYIPNGRETVVEVAEGNHAVEASWQSSPPDVTPPVVSSVQADSITNNSATITWGTDEPSDSLVRYGATTPPLLEVSNPNLVTSHSISLTGLSPETTYYFEVQSSDTSGNITTNNNNGIYYSFTTTTAPVATVPGCETAPFRQLGNYYYSLIFNYEQPGWYSGRDLNHDNAAFVTPFPICQRTRITGFGLDILASPNQGCRMEAAIYSDAVYNGNHFPSNLLWSANGIAGDADGFVEAPLDIWLDPGVYHVAWASSANSGCALPPGVHGTAYAPYIDSISASGMNEVFASYGGGGLPNPWTYRPWSTGAGAYYLKLFYAQY